MTMPGTSQDGPPAVEGEQGVAERDERQAVPRNALGQQLPRSGHGQVRASREADEHHGDVVVGAHPDQLLELVQLRRVQCW